MNDMIRAEREKIISRKSTKIFFFMGLALIAAYFFFFQFGYSSVFYDYDAGEMGTASGFAAIGRRKEVAAMFQGELSQGTLARMEQKIEDAKGATAGKDENSVFSATHVYRDQAAILEYLTNPDGTLKPLQEAYPNHESVILGYCDGWDGILSGMGSVLSILICLFVVTALSPVFAEEYSCHTDSVIYSARFGKTKLVTAKVAASLETAIGAYAVLLLFHVALYGATYGLQGGNVSIQSSLHYASSTYDLTFCQAFGLTVALNILGIIALAAITLFLSAKSNSPVSALILSCLVCFLPVVFDFTDSAPVLQKIQEICPVFMLHVNGIFSRTETYMGVRQPIVMFAFNLVLAVLFCALTKEVSRKHQVTG